MSKKTVFTLISICGIIFSPNSVIGGQPESTKNSCPDGLWEVTFADLQRKLISIGEDHEGFTGELGELVGYSARRKVFGEAVIDKSAMADYMRHDLNLITESFGDMKPITFIFNTTLVVPQHIIEGYYFLTDGAGEFKKAFVIRGKVDENNKAIPKSGKPLILNINDPDVQDRFDHEMQVWLKGMYRKKKTTSSQPGK